MRLRSRGIAGLMTALLVGASSARADDARTWFNKAVQSDVNRDGGAAVAFGFYRQAAAAGMPEAEFNVGVMLDSGRGVAPDVAEAATWYARAAARGNQRAAYNLGLLYESGQGVPRNLDLARAYFMTSDLAAARAHVTALRPDGTSSMPLSAPVILAPRPDVSIDPSSNGIEFVWTSQPEPEPVQFFVELRALEPTGSREVFTGATETGSLLATLPTIQGRYAWRVYTVAKRSGRYVAGPWVTFESAPAHVAPSMAMTSPSPVALPLH